MPRAVVLYAERTKQPSGCEIYRGNMPMYYLSLAKGWEAGWVSWEYLWSISQLYGPASWIQWIANHDVFVLPRVCLDDTNRDAILAFYEVVRQAGKRLVYEVDDDFTNRHRIVTAGNAMEAARLADAITVTTPYLADLMRKETGGKVPVYILPNCVSPEVWSEGEVIKPEIYADKVVIGLSGSITHERDWKVLKDVLPAILERPDVHLILMGYQPPYLENLPNTSVIGWLDYNEYASVVRKCDIILAPVDPWDGFNLGKSPIKVIEGMAARRRLASVDCGAATIATNNPVYRLAIEHERTGLLTEHTAEGWAGAINSLIENVDLRHRLQREGYRWVYRKHDMSRQWVQWARAYQQILRDPSNPIPIPSPLVQG